MSENKRGQTHTRALYLKERERFVTGIKAAIRAAQTLEELKGVWRIAWYCFDKNKLPVIFDDLERFKNSRKEELQGKAVLPDTTDEEKSTIYASEHIADTIPVGLRPGDRPPISFDQYTNRPICARCNLSLIKSDKIRKKENKPSETYYYPDCTAICSFGGHKVVTNCAKLVGNQD